METTVEATLTYWDAEKKIGFLDPDRKYNVAKSIFLHFTGLKNPATWADLRAGMRLSFTPAPNPSTKHPLMAVNAEVIGVAK